MRHLVLMWMVVSLPGFTQAPTQQKRPTAAVLDFKVILGVSAQEASALTSKFRASLVQTQKYTVLERGQMETILKEQDFTLTDLCNTEECAVQVGQLLAAEKMITGDIGKIGTTYTVTVRIIDVSTSKVDLTESSEYQGPTEGLIKTFDLLAQKLTGVYRPKSKTWMWVAGAAILSGGAAVLLLSGKASGGGAASVGTPPGNPQ